MDVIKVVRPKTEGHLIAHEYDQNFTRETVAKTAVATAQFAVLGAVANVFEAIDFAASDGSQNAAAIALRSASDTEEKVLVLKNGPAIVRAEELVWPAGATTNQKNAAIAQLRALNIKVDVQ
jgi:hypothetical protein